LCAAEQEGLINEPKEQKKGARIRGEKVNST